ncbi:MAG: hypothetical protein ACKV2V_14365 [Blastocatellia bacterium]
MPFLFDGYLTGTPAKAAGATRVSTGALILNDLCGLTSFGLFDVYLFGWGKDFFSIAAAIRETSAAAWASAITSSTPGLVREKTSLVFCQGIQQGVRNRHGNRL